MEEQKFMDLTPVERYELIGKIIDAMVYDHQAVNDVRALVAYFEKTGRIKSTFFPIEAETDITNILKTDDHE